MMIKEEDEFIITYTGKKVYPFNIKEQDISFEDIAHSLANKCRFAGHTHKFFSIAEHSILVANNAMGFPNIWGLFHDATEAYLPDISTTIKHKFPLIKTTENVILDQLQKKFNLPIMSEKEKKALKRMDLFVRYWEARTLMPYHPDAEWAISLSTPKKISIRCWTPKQAETEFIEFGREFLFTY